MIDASWVIVDRITNKPVFETYDFELCQFINIDRYKVVPIIKWLSDMNRLDRCKRIPYEYDIETRDQDNDTSCNSSSC